MSTPEKRDSWYDKKWKNTRAVVHRERRIKADTQRDDISSIGEAEPQQRSSTKEPSEGAPLGTDSVGEFVGTVAEVQRSYVIVMYHDDLVHCEVSNANIPAEIAPLAVGDRVTFDTLSPNEGGAVRQVLPRLTKLVRMREDRSRRSGQSKEEQVLAANVDVAAIVASAAFPPFHPRLIDRYLIMCQYGHVSPIICINKIDLVAVPPDLGIYEEMHIPVVNVSAETGAGLEDLLALLHGKYAVLTGHSGVGKSTIINKLLGREVLAVGAVGGKRGIGRHTTSASTLHRLEDSTYLVDTPGIRMLGLWEVNTRTLRHFFPEFKGYSSNCKFRNCLHVTEPQCSVKEAVDRGDIPSQRYESYLRMMKD
jgi:ribosome biogenesis GTPase